MDNPRFFIAVEQPKDKFGHWVYLDHFRNVEEVYTYISNYLKHCDKSLPLPSGPRTKAIITKYEDISDVFYKENTIDFKSIFIFFKVCESFYYKAVLAFIESGLFNSHYDYLYEEFEASYQGEYDNNEHFTQNLAQRLGYIDEDEAGWLFDCIDWTKAANEVMEEYVEMNGHYFRVL